MSGVRVAVRGFKSLEAALTARQKAAEDAMWEAVQAGMLAVGGASAKRFWPVKWTNVQDTPRRQRVVRGRAVSYKFARHKIRGLVIQKGFPTNPRSPAMRALLLRHGLWRELARTHLWVDLKRWGGAVRGRRQTWKNSKHQTRSGLTRLPITGRLAAWIDRMTGASGSRASEGGALRQTSVVNLRLARFRKVLMDLTLGPAVAEKRDTVMNRIEAAARSGLRRR